MVQIIVVCHPADLVGEGGRILDALRGRFGAASVAVIGPSDDRTAAERTHANVAVAIIGAEWARARGGSFEPTFLDLLDHDVRGAVAICGGVSTEAASNIAGKSRVLGVVEFAAAPSFEAGMEALATLIAKPAEDALFAKDDHLSRALSLEDLGKRRYASGAALRSRQQGTVDYSVGPAVGQGHPSAQMPAPRGPYAMRLASYAAATALVGVFGGAALYVLNSERQPASPERAPAAPPTRTAAAPSRPPPQATPTVPSQAPAPAVQPVPRPQPSPAPGPSKAGGGASIPEWECAQWDSGECSAYNHNVGEREIAAGERMLVVYAPPLSGNVRLRAIFRQLSDEPEQGAPPEAGLVFLADAPTPTRYYSAGVRLGQGFRIMRTTQGAWAEIATGSAPTLVDAVGSSNELALTLSGGTATLAINGEAVREFAYAPVDAKGYFGWYVTGSGKAKAIWDLSKVRIELLPPRTRSPARRPEGGPDVVDVSAFAPAAGEAGREILVQVYFHKPRQQSRAAAAARAADPVAERRAVTTLEAEVAYGQRIEARLEAPELGIDDPIQMVTWRGEPCVCQFLLTMPANAAGRNFHLRLRIHVAGVPVGKLMFSVKGVAASMPQERIMEMRGDSGRRYRRAFLSYASQDRVEVLNSVKYLKAAGIEVFQDILSLSPGEHWGPRIQNEIDRCDLFLLFWSSHAANSEWVRREAEYALARRRGAPDETPEITPFILEGPPVPSPPETLKSIHFNDPVRHVIVAELAARG